MTTVQRMGLAVLAGVGAGLGHAPFGLWQVSLVGFAALAWLVAEADRPARAAWAGGLGYFALTLHWIVEPFLVDVARHGWMAPFALVLMAGGLALFWGVAGWVSARLGGNRAIAWALAVSAAELARGHVLTGFPWALPAYIWAETDVRLIAALVGPYGLSVLTLLMCAFVVMRASQRDFVQPALYALGIAALLVGGALMQQGQAVMGDETVRLVQPNAAQHEKWDPVKGPEFVARMIDYTVAPKDGVDLIVWPETAIPYRLDRAPPVLAQIAGAADGVPVVTGINRVEAGTFRNALIRVGATGQADDIYDKVHLVPFGEYIPFGQLTQLIGMQSFAARDGYGFSPGEGVRLLETPLGRALPLICYEAIFPGHGRAIAERPDYLLQITNDAWFGTFSGPYQHLDQARFRAIEQGLPLVRVANTGVSGVIDPYGVVHGRMELGEAGFADVVMPEPLPRTAYARVGDLPLVVFLVVTLAALLVAKSRNTIAKPGGVE